MRQMKSLGSTVSALFWSGAYGLIVVYLTVFAPFVLTLLFINFFIGNHGEVGVIQNTAFMLSVLLFFFLPLIGLIWGWAHTLFRERSDFFAGAFIGIASPTLILVFLQLPEKFIQRSDLPSPSVFLLRNLALALFFSGWLFMTWLWFTVGKRFSVQTSLQAFVDSTALGQSSRGVRLLTVAILAQLLTLSASWLIYKPMFQYR